MSSGRENESKKDEYMSGFARIIRQAMEAAAERERPRGEGVYRWKVEVVSSEKNEEFTNMQWLFLFAGLLSPLISLVSLILYLSIYPSVPYIWAYNQWLIFTYGEVVVTIRDPLPVAIFWLAMFVLFFALSLISFFIVYYSRKRGG